MKRLPALTTLLCALSAAPALAAPLPGAPNCPVLPPTSQWNQRVDTLPVASGSSTLLSVAAITRLHPDFSNDGSYGIPFVVVPGTQPFVPIAFDYADESDPGPYPIPPDTPVEGGSDAHVLVVDRDACRLYETFASSLLPDGSWRAGSGAVFDLRTDTIRPDGWTSADAAGLPILPGLARADEIVGRGVVDHALRVTLSRTQRAYLFPARHFASSERRPWYMPMGMRLRLKSTFDTSSFGPQTQVLLTGLKRYGMIVADNGSSGFISGAPSTQWDDDDLHALGGITGAALEVVDTSSLTGTPAAQALNVSWYASAGIEYARFLHTASGAVRIEALRNGAVVGASAPIVRRQGYVAITMPAVAGATYRVRLG